MTEVEIAYMLGRLDVHIQRDPSWGVEEAQPGESPGFLVTVIRRCSPRFVEESAIARCPDIANAQALARIIIGVEFTRDGAAIWPDGRTEHPTPHEIILGLVEWARPIGWLDAPAWDNALAYLGLGDTESGAQSGREHPYTSGDDIDLDPETASQYRADREKDDLS